MAGPYPMLRHLTPLLLPLALLSTLSLQGCSGDDLYAHERAFLRVQPVSAVAPLYHALSAPGEWCLITIGSKQYHFVNAAGHTAQLDFTALINYGTPECVAGFVVGTPSVPDMNMQTTPQAYDLVCPNCYEENLLQRALTFSQPEVLVCGRCHRTYDLSNQGIENSGKGGSRLYHYRLTYAQGQDMLVVMN